MEAEGEMGEGGVGSGFSLTYEDVKTQKAAQFLAHDSMALESDITHDSCRTVPMLNETFIC